MIRVDNAVVKEIREATKADPTMMSPARGTEQRGTGDLPYGQLDRILEALGSKKAAALIRVAGFVQLLSGQPMKSNLHRRLASLTIAS
jgi:hypothetical protein